MMRIIKAQSQALCIQANNLTWKSFRVGHATHLAVNGNEIGIIMAACEWKSSAFAAYADPDTLNTEGFFNQTLERSDNEDDPEK